MPTIMYVHVAADGPPVYQKQLKLPPCLLPLIPTPSSAMAYNHLVTVGKQDDAIVLLKQGMDANPSS